MSQTETILWFDFETFGSLSRPWDRGRSGPYRRRDRPSQFGAIRTDLDLQPVGDPIEIRCTPPIDGPPPLGACASIHALLTPVSHADVHADQLPMQSAGQPPLPAPSAPSPGVQLAAAGHAARVALHRPPGFLPAHRGRIAAREKGGGREGVHAPCVQRRPAPHHVRVQHFLCTA